MTNEVIKCSDPGYKKHVQCDFEACTRCGTASCKWVDGPWPLGMLGVYGILDRAKLCADCIDALQKLLRDFQKK